MSLRADTATEPASGSKPEATTSTTSTTAERRRQSTAVSRFDGVERAVHWTTALLMIELLVTGAILRLPEIAVHVGHRALVENIHVYSGLGLLVPLIVGVLGPWRKRLVGDLRRFDRWSRADWDWFHRKAKRSGLPAGKFNGGQKAEAAFVLGAMIVMLATGVVMRFAPLSWDKWQQGATLVHDIGFILIGIGVLGHIYYALNSPEQLKSMLTGRISRAWARKHTPAWLEEVDEGNP